MSPVRILRGAAVLSGVSLAAAVAVAAAPGCSGEWSFALPPVEGGTPDPRYAPACGAWARSYCGYHQQCDGFFFVWPTLDQCIEREQIFCQLAALDPNVVFDEARLGSCRYPSACVSNVASCWPAGRGLTGAPCLSGQACRSGVCAGAQSAQGVCGVCTCGDGCGPGQICNVANDGGTCLPAPRDAGEACSGGADCASTFCALSEAGSPVCAPFVDAGDPCSGSGPLCASGLYCGTGGQCSVPERAAYDAACGLPDDGGTLMVCGGYGTCLGTCVAPARDQQECDPASGVNCVWPAKCLARHCVFPTLADCSP
jgi:hypothetical protein